MDREPLSCEEAELWREADRLLDALLDLPADQRLHALERAAPHASVQARVLQLLAAAEAAEQRFEGAVLQFAAEGPDTGTAFRAGTRIGRWVLEEEVGRGGMSLVFKAHDPQQPERKVAIKLLSAVLAGGTGQRHLQREQQALSRLSHPLIVPLIEAGVLDDGTPWLAMALVEGMRIDAWCKQRELDAAERVRLMTEVADAVAHAHRALVVHRDLKPANVLVDRDGKVRLLDFGIAGLLDPGGERTRTLMQALTPEYAAPEQFSDAPASTTIDVYGLGALLHRLLTGIPPARRSDADAPMALPSACVSDAAFADTDAATQARHALRGDLDAILLKALEHDPARRYPGAAELAADLHAWLDGRPVSAQRPTLRYRAGKFVRRHRGAVGVAGMALLAVLVALAMALWQSGRAAEAARVAELRAAEAARESARAEAVSSFMLEVFATAAAGAPRDRLPSLEQLLDAAERRIQEAFLDEPQTRSRLLLALGEVQMSLDRLERSQGLLSEAFDLAARPPGADPLTLARIEAELATAGFRRGEFDAALERSASALARLPSAAPGEAELAVREKLIGVRAATLTQLGRVAEAEALAREHWERVRVIPGVSDALQAGAAYDLGIALHAQGKSAEALDLLEQARALLRTVSGHWELKLSVNNALANVLGALRRQDEALVVREETLSTVLAGYPAGHVRIAQTRNNLASDLDRQGRTEEAVAQSDEALATLRAALGDAHPSVAAAHNNRGRALAELGRYEEAIADYLAAESIVAQVAPPSDRRLQTVQLSRADALIAVGRLAEGEALLAGLDRIGSSGSDASLRAQTEIIHARLHAARTHHAAAEASSLAGAEAANSAFPNGSGIAAVALGQAARAAAARGDNAAALRHIEAANQSIAAVAAHLDRTGLRYLRERHVLLRELGEDAIARRFIESDIERLRGLLDERDPRLHAVVKIAETPAAR